MSRLVLPDISVEQAKALAQPLRWRILKAMDGRNKVSPSELAEEFGDVPLTHVSYHVRKLLAFGLIKKAGTKPKRGVVEHYYRLAITHNGRAKK